ncbi:mesothelin-like [Rhinoraja longicauda]
MILINVIASSRFGEDIRSAPQSIRTICVLQVLRNVNNPAATVRKITSVLVQEIPPVLLTSNLSLSNVNNKRWTPSQSAVFFQDVVRSNNNFETFSPSVLQGFSCGAVKSLNDTTFLQLVQAMKGKGASLDEGQLVCISARLPSDRSQLLLDTLPVDTLLFFNSADFRSSLNCQDFFRLVGKSNIDILQKGSARRRNILNDAKACLGITGRNLRKENVMILGRLVCDLEGSVISESDISVLDALRFCTSFGNDQKKAIENLLINGTTKYGLPSSWSSTTFQNLGYLPLTFTNNTLGQVDKSVLFEALPRFIKKVKRMRPAGEVVILINQFNLRGRSNIAAICTEGVIGPEDISDLTPAIYNAAQLDICLSDAVLKDNVLQLGSLAFDQTQLKVLKNRLLQIYRNGLPESQVQLLGNISIVFNATEVSSWNITRVETLGALMKQPLENTMVRSIITRFLQLDGNLNAVSLKGIGGANLCFLDQEKLKTISNLT